MDNSSEYQDIEKTYQEYRRIAAQIKKDATRQTLPISIIGLLCILCGVSSIFWAGTRTSANLWCWGTALGILIAMIAFIVHSSNTKKQASKIAKPGFEEFFKRYNTWGTPKNVVNSTYFDTFRKLIGKE